MSSTSLTIRANAPIRFGRRRWRRLREAIGISAICRAGPTSAPARVDGITLLLVVVVVLRSTLRVRRR